MVGNVGAVYSADDRDRGEGMLRLRIAQVFWGVRERHRPDRKATCHAPIWHSM